MSGDITTLAVRVALGMHEMQARIASVNVANAGRIEARAMRADFAHVQQALAGAVRADAGDSSAALHQAEAELRSLVPGTGTEPISADEEIGDMVAASTGYQALTEALSRHFGLMRLAIAGRS